MFSFSTNSHTYLQKEAPQQAPQQLSACKDESIFQHDAATTWAP